MKQKRINKKVLSVVFCILVIASGLAAAGHLSNNTQIKNNVENYISLEKEPYSAPLNLDGNTLYVGGSGPDNYTRIQDAIDAAKNGDTVFVYNGTYYEIVLINKSLKILGEHRDIAFINSYLHNTVITITAPDVLIEGFTIQNSGTHHYQNYAGIKGLANDISLTNLNIVDNGIGVFLQNSRGHFIDSCQFINNGLYLDNVSNNLVINSTVNYLPLLYLEEISDMLITSAGQIVLNNCVNISVQGVYLENATVGMQILQGHHISFEKSRIENNSYGGIQVLDASEIYLAENVILNNWYRGIDCTDTRGVTIANNTFAEDSSIFLINTLESDIQDNLLTDCGIYLSTSCKCTILNNSLHGNRGGIDLDNYCSNNTISKNVLNETHRGISLEEYSTNNIIHDNSLTGGYIGIRLYRYSTCNTICNNCVHENYQGITIEFGCDNNWFNHNRINNNTCDGIKIEYATQQNICNNSFENNGIRIEGISYHHMKDNIVNGKPLIYLQNQSDIEIQDAGQVILVGCTDMHVTNQMLSNVTIGIQLIKSNNSIIEGNVLSENSRGIALSYSDNNCIQKNQFTINDRGVLLINSHENSIENNTIIAGGSGISLDSSHRNIISHNIVGDNRYYGVHVSYSNENRVSDNIIMRNNIGVYLHDYIEWLTEFHLTSRHNYIVDNNLYENYEYDGFFHNSLLNRWQNNFWNTSRIIYKVSGEIYAERGWHFGSPPPISFPCFRIDWHPAREPYDISSLGV